MSREERFLEALERIVAGDARYPGEAYLFVREALDFTQKAILKANKNVARHVTGQELLAGIREYGLSQFGPMTMAVLQAWGIERCEDFGEVVFNLVEHGLLSKTPQDSREDFKGGYDFAKAFRDPFIPSRRGLQSIPDTSAS